MSYTYGGGIREVVAYPDPNRQTKQKLGAVGIGALVVGLMVAAVAASISTGDWAMLVALPVLALALVGVWVSFKQQHANHEVDLLQPALVLNDGGIGNGEAQVPWDNVAAVDIWVRCNRRRRSLADKFTDAVGILDGAFLVRVTIDDTQPLSGSIQHFPTRQGNVVTFNVGSLVPSKQWLSLEEATRQHVQARGIATNE